LQASGRDVVLAVGRHARLPRRYRGADIMTWFERSGIFGDRADRVQDLAAARRQPSLQLIGSTPPRDLDLNALQDEGVRLAGRLAGIDGARLSFADDLPASIADADAKLADVLARIAPVADAVGAPSAQPIARIRMPVAPTTLDIFAERITSVVWATGFRRSYPWLHAPVIDQHGDIRQRAGVTSVPGLYTIGMRFQRRRRSNFIDGVGDDAQFLARYIAAHDRVRALA
jgi:putative flavoprotein involved in K+ transport